MTTVIAVQTEDDVILGWDSLATRSNEKMTLVEPKVWCRGGIIFGVSGTTRAMDLLYCIDFPEYDGTDARAWIITRIVPLIQAVLKENGQAALWDAEDGHADMGLILVVDGTAFVLDSLLSPSSTYEGIYTLGSGGDYARGALFAGADVMTALRVAADIDPYTGGHLTVRTASSLIIHEED
jgi:ATP-dependent protease HslVU (ClpYQ) peptidase subunit